jgi:hypothetical protein
MVINDKVIGIVNVTNKKKGKDYVMTIRDFSQPLPHS